MWLWTCMLSLPLASRPVTGFVMMPFSLLACSLKPPNVASSTFTSSFLAVDELSFPVSGSQLPIC